MENSTKPPPLKPLTFEQIEERRKRGFKHPNLVEDEIRALERALDEVRAEELGEADDPAAKPPVERGMFDIDKATQRVEWKHSLLGTVTIGIKPPHGFGKEDQRDPFTMTVPIQLSGNSRPDSIIFTVQRTLVRGIKLFRSQMNTPVDCTEGDTPPLTLPLRWVKDESSGRLVPATNKGQQDMDLVFLDTIGMGDGRRGAIIVLEVSLSTRRGCLYLTFQRVFAGQVVRTTAGKAKSIGLPTVEVGQQIGAVVPLMPENAWPGNNFLANFNHLASMVTTALSLEAAVPLCRCVVARWQPSTQPLPTEFAQKGYVRGTTAWFNAAIGCGEIITDNGEHVFAHFKSIEDQNGAPIWKQHEYPMLTPMGRVAMQVVHDPNRPNLTARAIRVL